MARQPNADKLPTRYYTGTSHSSERELDSTVNLEIGRKRLAAQGICEIHFSSPLEAVRALGAVQAQDYSAAMWAIGLRTEKPSRESVEMAFTDRTIVRAPFIRNTIHAVPSENFRWMLKLFSGRMHRNIQAIARSNHIELGQRMIEEGHDAIRGALQNGNQMTRNDLGKMLLESGIQVRGLAQLLLIAHAHADGLICYGPKQGSRQYLVLTDKWLPPFPDIGPDESLARVALQYFSGHGPATLQDFAWWTGLRISDVIPGLSRAQSELAHFTADKTDYWVAKGSDRDCAGKGLWLLPNYDEYTVGYKDREAIIRPEYRDQDRSRGDVALSNVIVRDGEVIGTWKRALEKGSLRITTRTFRELGRIEKNLLAEEIDRYISFMSGS
jgi:hypothetical protein